MNNTIAIVGAGITGLTIARTLHERGARVMVLEKSRGVGGRMATKRVGAAVFDQGAQFLDPRSEFFSHTVQAWADSGLMTRWPGGDVPRWAARGGMTAVAKFLSEGLDVKREHKVTAATHVAGGWELAIEDRGMVRVERLVLTAPVPQSLAVLRAGGVSLPETVGGDLARVVYCRCLALLVTLNAPSAVPDAGVKPAEGPLLWIADNAKKGVSPTTNGALTLHATPEFSAAHYAGTEEEIVAGMLSAARRWLGDAKVLAVKLHRWRFAEVITTWPEPCVWLPELALGFAGDGFGQATRVEGAVLSARALAEKIAGTLSFAGDDEWEV
jgi:predicted NAD/FAD-dependent oxidoreductase